MLTASDSFLEYLAFELPDIPVYWWRQSAYDEHAGLLKQNALNFQILGFFESGSAEYCLASLDLLGTDERTVLTQLQTVRDLLIATQFTPEYDYTNPDNPAPTGRMISWEVKKVRFLNIRTPNGARYMHYNCPLPLLYTRE